VNWTDFSGGPNGIGSIPRPSFFGCRSSRRATIRPLPQFFGWSTSPAHRIVFLYYLILTLALLTNLFVKRMRKLPVGRAWEALREDEIACKALGINPTNVKLSAFALGAMFGGFAGVFFAARRASSRPRASPSSNRRSSSPSSCSAAWAASSASCWPRWCWC
jgi:branched-chain amino acid transport system permease protein